jgi:hypothetical protein
VWRQESRLPTPAWAAQVTENLSVTFSHSSERYFLTQTGPAGDSRDPGAKERRTLEGNVQVQRERIRHLNDEGIIDGDYALYWMQEAQRAECKHAPEYAAQRANELEQRLLVAFGLTDGYPEANLRYCTFMLESLTDVEDALKERKIKFVVRRGSRRRSHCS